LYGYGANQVSSALATATTSGGNTTITLADSTKVTFTDVSALKSTSFLGS
jgi:hypothetical protein